MLPDPLFRHHSGPWIAQAPALADLLRQGERLARIRRRGRSAVPPVTSDQLRRMGKLSAVCAKFARTQSGPSQDVYRTAIMEGIDLRDALRDSMWPRWLDLERGLAHAIDTGDLLTLCLVLRTMGEEVDKGYTLLDVETRLGAAFGIEGDIGAPPVFLDTKEGK